MKESKKGTSLAVKMILSLIAGVLFGLVFMYIREYLNGNGQEGLWTAINNILFQDITAEGAESAIGIFYIAGQLFIKSLQLVIIPMVFTSIALAIGQIADAKTLGRISAKTIGWFLFCSAIALVLACTVGMIVYKAGFFNIEIAGLSETSGSAGANPLNVVLNVIPSNIIVAFSDNTAVLAIVFLAVVVGLSMNVLGEEKTKTVLKLLNEINDIVVVFLNFVVTKFGPLAIFFLISRTFATYGINYLKPAFAYMLVTTILLMLFLFLGYPILVWLGTGLSPKKFSKKIMKVLIFGFSTSSSAATLPLNMETTTKEFGVSEKIASFVLPLGMTINMNGTAIMQVIATTFIAGCAGYDVKLSTLIVVALLALIASAGTPAAPGAGAIILFTILSGVGYTNDGALLAYTLILAINRPIEMLVTSLNVVGDATACLYVAKSEGMLDTDIYNS